MTNNPSVFCSMNSVVNIMLHCPTIGRELELPGINCEILKRLRMFKNRANTSIENSTIGLRNYVLKTAPAFIQGAGTKSIATIDCSLCFSHS